MEKIKVNKDLVMVMAKIVGCADVISLCLEKNIEVCEANKISLKNLLKEYDNLIKGVANETI